MFVYTNGKRGKENVLVVSTSNDKPFASAHALAARAREPKSCPFDSDELRLVASILSADGYPAPGEVYHADGSPVETADGRIAPGAVDAAKAAYGTPYGRSDAPGGNPLEEELLKARDRVATMDVIMERVARSLASLEERERALAERERAALEAPPAPAPVPVPAPDPK